MTRSLVMTCSTVVHCVLIADEQQSYRPTLRYTYANI